MAGLHRPPHPAHDIERGLARPGARQPGRRRCDGCGRGPSWRYGRRQSGPGSRLHVRPRPVRPRRPCLGADVDGPRGRQRRSEEHTSELQSLMRSSYAVFLLKKKKTKKSQEITKHNTTTKYTNEMIYPTIITTRNMTEKKHNKKYKYTNINTTINYKSTNKNKSQ